MVSIRAAKSKGSQFEMDCEHSLRPVFPNIKRLGGEGQYREIDLECTEHNVVFECKRHAGFNWNPLVKIFEKLEKRAPDGQGHYLLFQANRQPPLVMYRCMTGRIEVTTFEDFFETPFEKHKTVKHK